jgi:hypothetical protein
MTNTPDTRRDLRTAWFALVPGLPLATMPIDQVRTVVDLLARLDPLDVPLIRRQLSEADVEPIVLALIPLVDLLSREIGPVTLLDDSCTWTQ